MGRTGRKIRPSRGTEHKEETPRAQFQKTSKFLRKC